MDILHEYEIAREFGIYRDRLEEDRRASQRFEEEWRRRERERYEKEEIRRIREEERRIEFVRQKQLREEQMRDFWNDYYKQKYSI